MANEARVLKTVENMLKLIDGCQPLRITNLTGVADVVACVRGRFVCVECKDDKHGSYKLTKGQKVTLNNFEKAEALCLVVDKYNLLEFEMFCRGNENSEVMEHLHWRDAL